MTTADSISRPDLARWLDSTTNGEWARQALDNLAETLCDHAHCEKKAAQAALALINNYPEDGHLVAMLAGLASEELDHFREIHDRLANMGVALTRDLGDPYAQGLHALLRGPRSERKLDRLLVSALIEARSCERFWLLAEESLKRGNTELAEMFRRLMVSELGHAALFLGLARRDDPAAADQRLAELRNEESRVVANLPVLPRIH